MKFYCYETTCFENDDDAAAKAAAEAEAKAAEEAAAAAAAKAKEDDESKFTQKQLEQIVVKRNKALKEKYEVLEATYTDLLKQTNLTEDARAKMEEDLKNVQKEMRTKEQQIEFEKKEAAVKHQAALEEANKRGDLYQELFETSTVERAIMDAANENDGFKPADFIAHLGPKAKVVDETINGEKTGQKVPMIEWKTKDEETGEVQVLLKKPEDVVKEMKEMPEHANLFNSNVAKGVGGGTAPGQAAAAGQIDQKRISTADYMKLANDNEARARMGLPPLRT